MKIYGDENNAFLLKELGERIRDIRIAHNMKQEEMAENSGISLSTVKRIEAGSGSTMENFIRILRLFNLIQNMEILIPAQQQTAEEIYKKIPKRQRASKKKEITTNFKWGMNHNARNRCNVMGYQSSHRYPRRTKPGSSIKKAL